MSSIVKLIIGVIVVAIITYIIIGYVYGKASIQDVAPSIISLSKQNPVFDSDSVQATLLTQGGSSVLGFLNVRFGDRTQTVGGDSFQTLLGVTGSFEFQVSPNAARLLVTTAGPTPQKEIIELPKLPSQKWMFLAILRDGRRFDILYDDRIVASQRLNYFPQVIQNPLMVGNTMFLGNAIHILVAPSRLTPREAARQRAKLADTTGEPVAASGSATFGLPPIPFSGIKASCIPGLPCNPITKPPKNHMKAWSTPYS